MKIDGVEFHVCGKMFQEWDEACGQAVRIASSSGVATLDVVIRSKKAARAWGDEAAVQEYQKNPKGVFERIEIRAWNRPPPSVVESGD